jgi:hypothetical protein
METLLQQAWNMLSPSLGTIALYVIGFGILLGVIRKMIDQFGNIKVLIGLGTIIIVAWAVRYVMMPPKVEIREVEKPVEVEKIVEVEKPVMVEKVVPDTAAINALKEQLGQMQREKESLAAQLNQANALAQAAEAEIQRLRAGPGGEEFNAQCPKCAHLFNISQSMTNEQIRCRHCHLLASAKTFWARRDYVRDRQNVRSR